MTSLTLFGAGGLDFGQLRGFSVSVGIRSFFEFIDPPTCFGSLLPLKLRSEAVCQLEVFLGLLMCELMPTCPRAMRPLLFADLPWRAFFLYSFSQSYRLSWVSGNGGLAVMRARLVAFVATTSLV